MAEVALWENPWMEGRGPDFVPRTKIVQGLEGAQGLEPRLYEKHPPRTSKQRPHRRANQNRLILEEGRVVPRGRAASMGAEHRGVRARWSVEASVPGPVHAPWNSSEAYLSARVSRGADKGRRRRTDRATYPLLEGMTAAWRRHGEHGVDEAAEVASAPPG
ncbi:hypothetical protein KM043_009401 [Ampulex compressa]|nr:hypothetical protein KM043_009401 [Ampulex compressa]